MIQDRTAFIAFLVEAKCNGYAAGAPPAPSSRPASHDLHYARGDYLYIDTYLGDFDFAGEEAVWLAGRSVWSMNYCGRMLVAQDALPAGFGKFLTAALLQVPPEAPYRGPAQFSQERFAFQCRWHGQLEFFHGDEVITFAGQPIYEALFHGGAIE